MMFAKLFAKKDKQAVGDTIAPLPKPQDIPQMVGMRLVVDYKQDPDVVWNLKAVLRPKEGSKNLREFRVFSLAQASNSGIRVKDYNTLDEHTDLILYHGWFDKKGTDVQIMESAAKDRLAS